ncbi:MAG: ribosome small subunit-dependent GTPase A [Planctomycetota bacterium]
MNSPSPEPLELPSGRVIRVDAKVVHVANEEGTRMCALRGHLFDTGSTIKNPVSVGDVVRFAVDGARGVVEWVAPRQNKLSRRAAGRGAGLEQIIVANVDLVLVVAALRRPPLRLMFIDRLLVSAEKGELPARICINKVDLAKDDEELNELDEELAIFEAIGYPTLCTSTQTSEGLEELRGWLKDKVTVLTGQSGVGKSSLLNALQPGLKLKTGHISKWKGLERGTHTTTHVSLLPLDFGGFVVDTPGMREFAFWDLEPGEVKDYFPEMRVHADACHYRGCTHTHEPDCAVKEALWEGQISRRRFDSYLRMIESLEDGQR